MLVSKLLCEKRQMSAVAVPLAGRCSGIALPPLHLTLQIPAGAASGARTLFIQDTNLDKTAASGAAVGATLGGWSCTAPGPTRFDGTYEIDGLAVGHSYTVYAEPLNGAVDSSRISNAIVSLCRNTTTDAG